MRKRSEREGKCERQRKEGWRKERKSGRAKTDREWGVTTKGGRHKDDMRGGRERERGKENSEG